MKKKLMILVSLTVFLFLSAGIGFSQHLDLNLIGAGARARAMGGAFIGMADDATAASWNPAGLARLGKAEASVIGIYTTIGQKIDDEEVEDLDLNHGFLNFASLAIPLSASEKNLVIAVAYQRMFDLYYKGEEFLYDDFFNLYYYDVKQTGGVDAISPAVGLQLTPQLSLGATFNIYVGGTTETWKSQETDEEYTAPQEKYSGSNVVAGVMLDFDKYRIGAIYRSPFVLKGKRDAKETEEIIFSEYEYKLKMPNMFGFGAAFEATPNLTLAADFEIRKYSSSEESEGDTEYEELGWEDVNQIRLGAEYLVFSGDNIIPLRMGFRTDAKPFKDASDEQVVGNVFTIGAGLIMGNINLDFAAEFGSTEEDWGSGITFTESKTNLIFGAVIHFGE